MILEKASTGEVDESECTLFKSPRSTTAEDVSYRGSYLVA